MSGLSRRGFLGSASALALLAPSAMAASLSTDFDAEVFDALVRAIAGPVEVAAPMLHALEQDFTAHYGVGALQGLVAHFGHNGVFTVTVPQSDPAIEDQVQWIAMYLYTGSVNPADADAPLANYPFALGWKSLRFAKAPGLCSGPEFGYWLNPWSAA